MCLEVTSYYDPEIGRWLSPEPNVDFGEFDEGAGLLAYNVYTYCANNPVIYYDPTGESITLTIFGITLGIKGIIALAGALTATAALMAYTTSPTFRRGWDNMVFSAVAGIDRGLRSLGGTMVGAASWASSQARSIAKSISDSFARTRTMPKYRSPREVHHIVAQQAPNAGLARNILNNVGIGYNSPYNLVSLKTGLHRRLHTNQYYGWANSVIISAYNSANGNRARQSSNVIGALNTIRGYLLAMDATSPY